MTKQATHLWSQRRLSLSTMEEKQRAAKICDPAHHQKTVGARNTYTLLRHFLRGSSSQGWGSVDLGEGVSGPKAKKSPKSLEKVWKSLEKGPKSLHNPFSDYFWTFRTSFETFFGLWGPWAQESFSRLSGDLAPRLPLPGPQNLHPRNCAIPFRHRCGNGVARTLAFPCFLHCLLGVETEGLLDYQGRAGDHFHCAVEPSPGHIGCRVCPHEARPYLIAPECQEWPILDQNSARLPPKNATYLALVHLGRNFNKTVPWNRRPPQKGTLKSATAPKRFYRTLQKVLSNPCKGSIEPPFRPRKGSIEPRERVFRTTEKVLSNLSHQTRPFQVTLLKFSLTPKDPRTPKQLRQLKKWLWRVDAQVSKKRVFSHFLVTYDTLFWVTCRITCESPWGHFSCFGFLGSLGAEASQAKSTLCPWPPHIRFASRDAIHQSVRAQNPQISLKRSY